MARIDSRLLDRIRQVAGSANVSSDPGVLESHGRDWTRFYQPAPSAVVFARDESQLLQLVNLARSEHIALVPSGGRTGLSGGAVACRGEVVVSFDRMNRILAFSETDRTVTVEAGVITSALQSFAASHDLQYPVDFASSGSSQIGGNIATNAGGIRVLRYGLTRDHVAGLKVITGGGQCLDLNKSLIKNATGYDLRHLFIGSEGTLGLIVEATMKLSGSVENQGVVLLAVDRMVDIVSILEVWKRNLTLTAFEFFSGTALGYVVRRLDLRNPLATSSRYYVLAEYEIVSGRDEERVLEAWEECSRKGWITDGVMASSGRDMDRLWRYREAISESITPFTPYKNDVSVRVSRVPDFLFEVESVVGATCPEFEVVWFGHIGDGNLHLNILKPDTWSLENFRIRCEEISDRILDIVSRYDGSISAEHGIGLLKRNQLHFSRTAEEISLMKSLKQVFDPDGIMNPGKLFAEAPVNQQSSP